MTRTATGYCAACDTQVTGDRARPEDNLGPDGSMYCTECMRMLRLLQEQRHPGSAPPVACDAPEPVAARARSTASVARAGSPKGARTAPPSSSATPLVAGAALLLLAGIGGWWMLRSGGGTATAGAQNVAPVQIAANVPDPTPATPKNVPVEIQPPANRPEPANREPESTPPKNEPPPANAPAPKNEPPAVEPKSADEVVAANDAATIRARVGKSCTVRGVASKASRSQSGKVFRIEFGRDRDAFEAVIFAKQFSVFESRFGDLTRALQGKTLQIHGKIALYQDRPQIVLDDPAQLEVK